MLPDGGEDLPAAAHVGREGDQIPLAEPDRRPAFRRYDHVPLQQVAYLPLVVGPGELGGLLLPDRPGENAQRFQLLPGWSVDDFDLHANLLPATACHVLSSTSRTFL